MENEQRRNPKPNLYIIYEDYAEMILENKNHEEVARAIIDLDDVERCKKIRWHAHKNAHGIRARASIGGAFIHLSRFIIGYNGAQEVDHINRNPLDNRKSNLRVVTRVANLANRASKGIQKTAGNKYQANFTRYGQRYISEEFETAEEAEIEKQRILEKLTAKENEYVEEYYKTERNPSTGIRKTEDGKWTAHFKFKGIEHNVGVFDTEYEAFCARLKAIGAAEALDAKNDLSEINKLLSERKHPVSVEDLFGLTTEEASVYSGLSKEIIESMVKKAGRASWFFKSGTHVIIIRKEFDKLLNRITDIADWI